MGTNAAGISSQAEVEAETNSQIEATGSADGLELALSLVRPTGAVVLKSTCAGDSAPQVDWNRVVVDEIRIIGSRCGPLDVALAKLADGTVVVSDLIDFEYPAWHTLQDLPDQCSAESLESVARVVLGVLWRLGVRYRG